MVARRGRRAREAGSSHVRAVGSRGRPVRRQGTRCEGYCEATLSAPLTARSPAPGNGHTHEEEQHRYRSERVSAQLPATVDKAILCFA